MPPRRYHPMVSVIIPTHRGANLNPLLDSLDNSTFKDFETIVKNVNGEIKILDMDNKNFPYPFVSIDDDGVLEFKNPTTDEIKKVRMTNTTNEIKNKDVVILINSIRTSMENYLNILAKEFKNINLYNLDSNTEIYAQQYTVASYHKITPSRRICLQQILSVLHGLILQSKNMIYILIVIFYFYKYQKKKY